MIIARSAATAAMVLSVSVALAAPSEAETMSGALAKAYANNSTLNSARAGQRATDENVPIAKSGFRPTIAGTGNAAYSRERGSDIRTGSFGITLRQTLFDGFQTLNTVRAAEAGVQAGQESLRNTAQNTLFDAASAYMDVIQYRQIARLREQSLSFLNEQVRAANARLEVGEGTKTDVAQAQASQAAAVAQLSAARAQVKSAEAVYRQVVGTDPGTLAPASALRADCHPVFRRPIRSPKPSIRPFTLPNSPSTPQTSRSRRRKAHCCRQSPRKRARRAITRILRSLAVRLPTAVPRWALR